MGMGEKKKRKKIVTSKTTKKTALVQGRPAFFDTPEQLQKAIDAYFETCKPTLLQVNGKPVLDKSGQPMIDVNPPTVSGLADFLGFASRQSVYDYAEKKEFAYTIKKAITRIEIFAERQLFSNAKPTGAIFWLKNHGWKAEEIREQKIDLKGSISSFSVNQFLEKFNAEK